ASCLPRPEDAGGPPPPRLVGGCVWPAGAFKPSASARALATLSQHCRGRGPPCGLQDTLSTLRPSCAPCVSSRLRHGRKTRYGRVARPDPTGTCTLPETPSFAWRENAGPQAPPRATATQERRLLAVACRPMLGWEARSPWPQPCAAPWSRAAGTRAAAGNAILLRPLFIVRMPFRHWPSALSTLHLWVEAFEFDSGLRGREWPVNTFLGRIAP